MLRLVASCPLSQRDPEVFLWLLRTSGSLCVCMYVCMYVCMKIKMGGGGGATNKQKSSFQVSIAIQFSSVILQN